MTGTGQPHAPQDESLLPTFRALMACARQVERVASRHVETLGLTLPQFDVITTLGDTQGMTVSEIAERTLITRGTLKPVLDRLEARGMVRRCKGERDARQVVVSLTEDGQALYEKTFPLHLAFLKQLIDNVPQDHQSQLISLLGELEQAFK